MPGYVDRLRALVEECAPRLLSLDEEATGSRLAPGKWSAREIIGHLIDSASNNHQRFVRSQLQGTLVFPTYEQERWVSLQHYHEAPWGELVDLWRAFNLHLARVMEAVPEEVRLKEMTEHNLDAIAWQTVPSDRSATLDHLMEDYVGHLEHHLVQVLGEELGRPR